MGACGNDVPASLANPRERSTQIVSSDPRERVNREIKLRADANGRVPNDDAITRLVVALMPQADEEWALAWRCMRLETLACVAAKPGNRLSAVAAWPMHEIGPPDSTPYRRT